MAATPKSTRLEQRRSRIISKRERRRMRRATNLAIQQGVMGAFLGVSFSETITLSRPDAEHFVSILADPPPIHPRLALVMERHQEITSPL